MAVMLEMEVVLAVEKLEQCSGKWAFARFHPPDHWSRKQSWREEWYDLANAVEHILVDSDLSTLGRALVCVVCLVMSNVCLQGLAAASAFRLQRGFSLVSLVMEVYTPCPLTSTSTPPRRLQGSVVR